MKAPKSEQRQADLGVVTSARYSLESLFRDVCADGEQSDPRMSDDRHQRGIRSVRRHE